MYRERHGHQCQTNGQSVMVAAFDGQIAKILLSLQLEEGVVWPHR